ncbi:NAD(P)H-binding protein [Streptomyces mobaraensis]|uniref:NAD(P)H-binding protein n=1 Tax=Streptomyces mobaraensis TaxID=35621 RepID=UPI0033304C12
MFVVTGASGKLGRLAVQHLIERVDAAKVVALTRTPDRAAGLGVRVRAADFDDPGSLARAFEGAERVLLVSTDALGRRVAQHAAAIEAAAAAGARQLVYTSLVRAGEPGNPSLLAPEHRETERVLAESGVPFTVLRHNIYPDMLHLLAPLREAVATGVLSGGGDGDHVAYVTRADCAAVGAAILAEGGHTGQFLEVTGPAAVDRAGVAEALAEATGRPVRYERRTRREEAADPAARGVAPELVSAARQFWDDAAAGWMDVTTHVVERVAGRPPVPLAEFFAGCRNELLGG